MNIKTQDIYTPLRIMDPLYIVDPFSHLNTTIFTCLRLGGRNIMVAVFRPEKPLFCPLPLRNRQAMLFPKMLSKVIGPAELLATSRDQTF